MPLERDEIEYVNTSEGADVLGVTFVTFKTIIKSFGLRGQRFIGKGQKVFYPKTFVEKIRDTPPDKQGDLKKEIEEFQRQKI